MPTLTVRNRMPNPTVFSKTVKGDFHRLTFKTAGTRGDTQRVPVEFADDIEFLNSVESGILEVIDGPPEIMEALKMETDKATAARETEVEKVEGMMDRRQDKDLLSAKCIAPAPAGRKGECGAYVMVRHTDRNDTPPLCGEHQYLAPTFTLTVEGSKGYDSTETRDGEVRRVWRQATLTEPVVSRG